MIVGIVIVGIVIAGIMSVSERRCDFFVRSFGIKFTIRFSVRTITMGVGHVSAFFSRPWMSHRKC